MSKFLLTGGLAVGLLLAGCGAPSAVETQRDAATFTVLQSDTSGIIPPNAHPHGKSYGEWNAAWWTWALSVPWATHPLTQLGAVDLTQPGDVWFLGGAFGTNTVERTGTVPAGTSLFFPILNTSWSEDIRVSRDGLAQLPGLEVPGVTEPFDLADWRALASLTDATDLTLRITSEKANGDTQVIVDAGFEDLKRFYVESPVFEQPLLPGTIYDTFCQPGGGGTCWREDTATIQSFASGYYIFLNPLPVGTHTIRFTGTRASGFALDVTYVITVEPGKP